MIRKCFVWLAVFLICAGITGRGSAAPNLWLSVEDMAQTASYVVEGRVLDVHGEWNADRTQIFSLVRFSVTRSLKDQFPLPEITLRMLGGEVPEEQIGMYLPELPRFRSGDDMILFLEDNPQSPFPVVGQTQGAIQIQTDPASGQIMAVSQEGTAMPKAEFERRVLQAVQR